MASTWNRNVTYDAAGDVLVVTKTPPNPPPPAIPGGRKDTANRINVHEVDRKGGPARMKYRAKDGKDANGKKIEVKLTGIAMKIPSQYRGGRLRVFLSPAGKVMTLTITKDSDQTKPTDPKVDEHWDYYVQAAVNGAVKQTKDPRIWNRAL